MTRIIMIISAIAVPFFTGAVAADTAADEFTGAWKTTLGPVTIAQKGEEVTGTLDFYKLKLEGKVKEKVLTCNYDEGALHVDATWTLDASGNAFQGTFRASNGNRGVWNGWRPDPAASRGEPADFSGLWLTDMGLMELTRDGAKVKGRYALRGTSNLEGDVKGRHLEFRIEAFRTGPGWFDLDERGTRLTGAGGTDGMPGWYGWNGRKAPEFVRHARLVAGEIVDGSTTNLLTYSVRAPDAYKSDDGKNWPVVLILHGSNMNGKAYVNTLANVWPDIARDYILLGINGETPSNLAADQLAFNYTYINYVGRSTFRGFPGTDRESPALVREAMDELKRVYPIKHYLVGGHSQGGFLTYSLLMNSPEAVAGAFPISAAVIFQCDPSAFADKGVRAAQRAVPLAIVHGKTDPLVPFSGGSDAADSFRDEGWPALRFFADDHGAHMFARLPVGPAIRWLDAMASDDPGVLLDFAESRLKASAHRDVIAAIGRARKLKLDAPMKARLDRLTHAIDELAAPQSATYLAAIRADKDHSWVDGFLAFRSQFEFADVASDVMAAFNALRAEQNPPGQKAIGKARTLFQQGRREEGYTKLKEIVEKYPASTSYRLAKKWLAEKE